MSGTSIDLGDHYKGLYQWVSTPDGDGDLFAMGNTRKGDHLVMHVKTKAGTTHSALVSYEEVRSMLMAALDLMNGERPKVSEDKEL